MSHHDHDQHGHHHNHTHHDPEVTDVQRPLSETDKMVKMVEHWIHHNEEHARSYREWADRAQKMGQDGVGGLLEEVAGTSLVQNQNLEKVLALLKASPPTR